MAKRKSLGQMGRRAPVRAPRFRIVLVCEGEKTERLYFSLYVELLRAANVRLEIPPRECGTDPLSVVNFGIGLFKNDSGIDVCFCVIDRDSHTNFHEALRKVADFQGHVKSPRRLEIAASYPSFEYWLLMHFGRSRKPYVREGHRSPAEALISDLKCHLPGYEKNAVDPMRSLLGLTNDAIINSEFTYQSAIDEDEMNPSTQVHTIVSLLQEIRN